MMVGEIYLVYFFIIFIEIGDLKINIIVIFMGFSDVVICYFKVEVSIIKRRGQYFLKWRLVNFKEEVSIF